MSKILLIDVDSKIANLALMKISAYHKNLGDRVFLNKGCSRPDKVYISCVFSQNRGKALGITKMFNCPVEIGGYGVNNAQLPHTIEHMMPNYSLYGIDFSMGYTSRGCLRKCPFCIVWKKEGIIRDHASISEFWNSNHKKCIILDNNFLASPQWKRNLEFIITHQLQVSFCQGLDIRLVNHENATWLAMIDSATISFISRMYYFAFDDPQIEDDVRRGVAILKEHGIKPRYLTFYVLCGFNTSHEEDMHRFMVLRKLGVTPYIMKYNDRKDDPWLNHFDRWVNAPRHIYAICSFEEYSPYKKFVERSKVRNE